MTNTKEFASVTKHPNIGALHVRKWLTTRDEILATESGRLATSEPVVRLVVAAVVHNRYAGRFGESLDDVVADSAELGKQFAARIAEAATDRPWTSYGKACLVGSAGEYEHGNALLTTEFATPVRQVLDRAIAWIPSTGKRGGPGTALDIPLAHCTALYVRSHYDTVTVTFGDGPAPDEIVVAVAVSTGGRLFARLGGPTAEDVLGEDGLR